MKAVRKALIAPPHLQTYVVANPLATWEQFRSGKPRYRAIQQQLLSDQRGLCAYCEIQLLTYPEDARANDFRVEHFWPKSPHLPPPNWALEWKNLLGCCHGGTSKSVIPPSRFNPSSPSCDVPKQSYNWVGFILDPLTIPALDILFGYKSNGVDAGEIFVNMSTCPPRLLAQAQESIVRLKLNAVRLKLARETVIKKTGQQLVELVNSGMTPQQAFKKLSEIHLDLDSTFWPAFPTCIRSALGTAAEHHLNLKNYIG